MSDSPALTIRGQRTDDWEDLYGLLTLKEVLRDTVELPYAAEDTFREQMTTAAPNTYTLIAESGMPSGRRRFVGVAWLTVNQRRRRQHIGSISLITHPDQRGSEAEHALIGSVVDLAQNWLGLRRIEVKIYTDQTETIALYEQHGFKQEATLRRYAFRDGEYSDAILMAWLRSEVS